LRKIATIAEAGKTRELADLVNLASCRENPDSRKFAGEKRKSPKGNISD
jgi:hypothetical protein